MKSQNKWKPQIRQAIVDGQWSECSSANRICVIDCCRSSYFECDFVKQWNLFIFWLKILFIVQNQIHWLNKKVTRVKLIDEQWFKTSSLRVGLSFVLLTVNSRTKNQDRKKYTKHLAVQWSAAEPQGWKKVSIETVNKKGKNFKKIFHSVRCESSHHFIPAIYSHYQSIVTKNCLSKIRHSMHVAIIICIL